MFTNTTVVEIIDYEHLFVGVHGVVVAGWVGFAIFVLLLCATVIFSFTGLIKERDDAYRLTLFTFVLLVSYLLCALEQFVILRDDWQHVNLLMLFVNAAVWYFLVFGGSAEKLARIVVHPVNKRYSAIWGGVSQVLFISAAWIWNGVVYAVWALGLVTMMVALVHYYYPLGVQYPRLDHYSKFWLYGTAFYSALYVGVAGLSHTFFGALSLPAAVWAYVFMHVFAYTLMVVLQRLKTHTLDIGSSAYDTPPAAASALSSAAV